MRAGQSSRTAVAVGVARGVGLSSTTADGAAARVLPGRAGRLVRWFQGHGAHRVLLRRGARVGSAGLVDHVSLRTMAIDCALEQAAAAGLRQLVILGAGFDGRALRLLRWVAWSVFEVDHPTTQEQKRARLAGGLSAYVADHLRLVAVDFTHDDARRALEDAGHRADQPTAWVWEGVTPYLPHTAIESTLAMIEHRSACKSELLMTYAVPELAPLGGRLGTLLARGMFRGLGEPLLGAMSPEDACSRVEAHGFRVTSDTGQPEWAARAGRRATLAWPFRAERLLHARRNQPFDANARSTGHTSETVSA